MERITDIFRDYIANDRLLEALNLLREYLKGRQSEAFDQLLLVQSRFKKFQSDENDNLKSEEYLRVERQQVVRDMLAFANSVDQLRLEPEPEPDNNYDVTAIVAAVYANVHGMIIEDLDLTMATLHPDNPGYPGTRELIQNIFNYYDLRYEIRDIQLLQYTPEMAVLQVVQRTLKVSGPAFNNNESILLHTLKKEGRIWKIYGSAIKQMTVL